MSKYEEKKKNLARKMITTGKIERKEVDGKQVYHTTMNSKHARAHGVSSKIHTSMGNAMADSYKRKTGKHAHSDAKVV